MEKWKRLLGHFREVLNKNQDMKYKKIKAHIIIIKSIKNSKY